MKTIDKLKTLVILAECNTFTEAAEKLYCSQPTVSTQIHSLEEIFGVKLFDRIGRNISINQNGKELLLYAQKIIDLFNEAQLHFNDKEKGAQKELSICASNYIAIYILPIILGNFRKKYPHINIKLQNYSYAEILDLIFSNKIDGAYMPFYELDPIDSRLSIETLVEDPFVLTVSPSHPWAKNEFITKSNLEQETILLPQSTSAMKNFLENNLKLNDITINNVIELSNIEAIKKGVISNLGFSIIPKLAIETELQQGILNTVELSEVNIKRKICYVQHKNKKLSTTEKVFLDLVLHDLKPK
ncbi:LysR family transcriptional regulator [Salipaludibacillus sp. CF4.18]|uniref:LysR family transcriptional regulator n=1 Tax=Salipaludibacillus sp. CF4.18 TaxID=3373081 RepID=UPI003EE440E0